MLPEDVQVFRAMSLHLSCVLFLLSCPLPPHAYPRYVSQIIRCGLDSVVARRWINDKLHSLVDYDEDGEVEFTIPLIDGGTEAFKGSARVIQPGKSACIECTLDLFPPQVKFPMCTIATRPRLP